MTNKPIAITTGEPAGIGPEISVRAAFAVNFPVVLIGDRALLTTTAKKLGLPANFPRHVTLQHVACPAPVVPGKLDTRNSDYVIKTLEVGNDGALTGDFAAVATAPVQKSVLCTEGREFTGHTEFFAKRSGVDHVVMMLVSDTEDSALKVALVTTHLPIAQISAAITPEKLDSTIAILNRSLKTNYGLDAPKIAVTGLNPHAGESGHLGREEIDVITPAIERARASGIMVTGPWPADTLFVREFERRYDAILCMYHDQGLPVLKREGFGVGVNVTLGLPWIRTSVDHGTALDIAGSGRASMGSMVSALTLARRMAHRANLL